MGEKLQRAVAFLQWVLSKGPLPSQRVWEQVQQAGYSRRTYERARRVLRVHVTRSGYGGKGWWVLSLPPPKASPFPGPADSGEASATTPESAAE